MGPVKGGSLSNLLKDIQIPKMFRAEQSFKKDRIEPEQIPGVVREQTGNQLQDPAGNEYRDHGRKPGNCQCKCDYPRDR